MFEWADYLTLANALIDVQFEPREAASRTATSRAYYAAFHRCRETLERQTGENFASERVHAAVIRALRERQQMTEAGLTLDRLRRKRAHADYNAERPFPLAEAQTAIELAGAIIRSLPAAP